MVRTTNLLTRSRILSAVDANAFASLVVLNRVWYEQAQKVELYAHHLSRCPSYALCNSIVTGPFRKNDLLRLKTKFAAEVRRNLYEAYIRPRRTLVNLISVNTSSSAAFPGGEVFRFAFSPNGQTILALSSSRIYVLDPLSDVITVRRELKTLRRPVSASITDDGSLLAVLSSKHQANIYGFTPNGIKHLQVLVLDNPPRTIALAHEGTVLAAAYAEGVEVFSLAANALSTDRRAVRSEAMDTLNFSGDGSMLVGSSQSLDEPNAVVINAPFYTENDPDLSSREIHSRMWTTQILFPQISSICSHAELLQGHTEGDANWLFAYDHSLMAFRAVRTDDTRSGVAYFLNPPVARRWSMPSPNIAPSASACGTLVVAGFAGTGLWLYGVPEKLDTSPDMGAVVERYEEKLQRRAPLTSATGHLEPLMAYSPSVSGSSEDIEDDSLAGKVDWRQSLFVKCCGLKTLDGISAAKWVERPHGEGCGFPDKRLVTVAPGGVSAFGEELGDESMPVDGSRICVLDFGYGPTSGEDREVTIEVGDGVPELLTEHTGDMNVEVDLERRRTMRGPRGARATARTTTLSRSFTTASPPSGAYFDPHGRQPSWSQPSSPSEQTPVGSSPRRTPSASAAHLQRSATSAGFQTALYPPRPPLGSAQGHNMYHRSADRRPSTESWETPPPPYPSGIPSPSRSPYMPPAGAAQHAGNTWGMMPNVHSVNSPDTQTPYPTYNQYNAIRTPVSPPDTRNSNSGPARNFSSPAHLESVNETSAIFPVSSNGNLPYEGSSQRGPGLSGEYFVVPGSGVPDLPAPDGNEADLRPTITHPLSPPTPEREQQYDLTPPARLDVPKPSSAGSVTLTGSNLQNRLMHPTPPTPNSRMDHSATAQRNDGRDAFAFSGPTSDQMANLERRMSGERRRPPQINTSSPRPSSSRDQVPPSPPRAAWGAAGVPGSPSFNKAQRSPNGLSRPESRGSGRAIQMSASTPNLLAPQRPKYGRLDTIDSVGSHHTDGGLPSRPRANSVADHIPSPVVEGFGAEERRAGTDPPFEPKKKRGKRRKGDDERSQMGFEGVKKSGRKCIVM